MRSKMASAKINARILRASVATKLAKNNTPINTVAKILRHADPATTSRYYIYTEQKDARIASEKMRANEIQSGEKGDIE